MGTSHGPDRRGGARGAGAPRGQRRARRAAFLACALGLLPASGARAADPFLRHTATVKVAREAGPAVVGITTAPLADRNPFGAGGDPYRERFFEHFGTARGSDPNEVEELGSGVIIDADGHVLTNEHVIAMATRIQVRLADARSFPARIVGADPNNDLAVLEIETDEKLPWIPPGRSDDLMVGEPVIAIGSPFGLSNTVTTGVISALDRSFHTPDRSYSFHGFIQTDASINPGNSGGPLLNAEGTLIGINSALHEGGQGIGFALPIDVARRVMEELIEHGEVTPIWLGAEFQNLDPSLHQVMEVPSREPGVLVTGVRPGSPAERGGLRRGDVMLRVDGRALATALDVVDYLETMLVDQDLTISVWRKPERLELTLRTEAIPVSYVHELAHDFLGLDLEEDGGGEGFAITGVRHGSRAEQIGFRPGDRLLAVNGRRLGDDDDLRRAIVELRKRARASVVVQRGNGRYHVTIPLV